MVHVFNKYNGNTAGVVPNVGISLPSHGRVAISLDATGTDPSGISRILFHEFVKHRMLKVWDGDQKYDHRAPCQFIAGSTRREGDL